jgi:transcriptional regulator EpsA
MFNAEPINTVPTLGASLLGIARQASQVRRHLHLLHWLQGDLQQLLPHDVLIAAWGDFSLDLVQLDIVSANPALRSRESGDYCVRPMVRKLFDWWYAGGRRPATLDARHHDWFEQLSGDLEVTGLLRRMRTATVHGIKDERGRHDCLYIALSRLPPASPFLGEMLETLLPYIDTALRQVPLVADEAVKATDIEVDQGDNQLTEREVEIMNWVRLGKTNVEIAMILNISAFTVKNHMQRILRKLNVTNRAQASSKVEQWQMLRHGGREMPTASAMR